MSEAIEDVPGVRLPCGHIYVRPEPAPLAFDAHCAIHGVTWRLTSDAGGQAWTAQEKGR